MSVWIKNSGKRRVFDFTRLLEDIEGKNVIVEGKKDEKALKTLGIKNIIAISGKPLIDVIKHVRAKETVILTDFDREGRKMEKRLTFLLNLNNIRVDKNSRIRFMKFGKTKLEDFNSLNRGDNYVKISSHFNQIHNKGSNKGRGSNRKT